METSPTHPSLFPAAADPGCREPSSSQPVERGWAWAVRQRLAAQLQETGRPDPQHVDALVAELIAVFAKVLQKSSRNAWLHLLDALRLLRPFREQLRCREQLLPYLESLSDQYHRSQALVSDLDVLGAMDRAFPKDHSELCAHPLAACCRDPAPPAKLLPVGSAAAFAGQLCPFVFGQEVEEPAVVSQPGPVSLQELQSCVGVVGMELAQDETQWKSSLGLMSLALGTEVPVKYCCAEPRLLPDTGREAAAPAPQGVEGEGGLSWPSLTGIRAAEIFVRNRHLGKINFVYLNVAPNRHFRPYDLVVVPKRQANPEHYVFSPFGVLHVHPEEGAEALTLGEWHRQAMLWQLLQCIPFFKHCLVRKAFARWWQNVKHLQLLRRQEALGNHHLLAVPHFGAALLHISRLLKELKSVHWLPQDDSKCYTFPELQRALAQENGRARGLLRRFLTLCSAILELVRDDTYKMVHGLQTQVQSYKLYITKESLYQQRVHYRGLERRLKEAEFWMQRLGSLAQLVNILTCQNLVSIVQEEVTAFVSNVMKADGTTRKAVLRVHLVFDADSQLVPFPSRQVLESSLLGALDTVVESVLQVTRTRKEKPVTQPEQSPGDTETLRDQGLGMALCKAQPSALREADKGGAGTLGSQPPDELLQSLPAEVLCGQEPQLVHHLDLKVIGGLEVSGHRLRSQYPVPSREQLEQNLRSDSSILGARASQWALLEVALNETQEICKQLAWVAEIHSFAHSWSPKHLELMKGWPAREYVQRVVQLRAWAERVKEVPSTVITCNRLLFVDCSSVQQEIVPLLDSVIKEILCLLLNETSQHSESLIAELGGVVQLYQSVSTDIFTIAKCFQKLEQYQGQMTELQERVEYVRALNEVIHQCFRPLSLDEENLENTQIVLEETLVLPIVAGLHMQENGAFCICNVLDNCAELRGLHASIGDEGTELLDTWEAFVYQQQEASDFIVSRRLSIIAELVDSLQRARGELQELLTMATTGRFLDPSQSPRAMEKELHELHRCFQAMASRVAELCRSQRILTGMGAMGPPVASVLLPGWLCGQESSRLILMSLLIPGESTDVSFVARSRGLIEAHENVWRLLRTISEQITEWKCLAFSKVMTSTSSCPSTWTHSYPSPEFLPAAPGPLTPDPQPLLAQPSPAPLPSPPITALPVPLTANPQPLLFNAPLATEKIAEWEREASHMEKSLPADHPILQACVHVISSFQQFLPLLQKLASPLMKSSCWREIFMGELQGASSMASTMGGECGAERGQFCGNASCLGPCIQLGRLQAQKALSEWREREQLQQGWRGRFWEKVKELGHSMGVKCPANLQFTLGQLLSYPLLEHSDTILKIWSSERGRCHSLDMLRRLQKTWAERQFRLVNFILNVPYQAPLPDRARQPPSRRHRPAKQEYVSKDTGTFVLSDTAELKALTEKSLLTLKSIIFSPHAMELREEAESWTSTLHSFGALLDVWVSFQQKWIFLNIVLYEMDISLPSSELDCLFQQLDSRFRELMQVTCADPLVLSSVMPVHTSSRESRFMGVLLQAMLSEGVGNLQLIIQALEYVLEATRMSFPRLFFLSNAEVVAMVASPLEPTEVTIWARRCFPTVQQIVFREPSTTRDPASYTVLLPTVEATGLVGAYGEMVPLCSSLPLNQKVTKWLSTLEQHMKEALFHLLQACMAQRLALRPQLDTAFEQRPGPTELPLHLLVEHWVQLATSFPAQCVLLAEEALWFADVQERLFSTLRRRGLKLKHRLKLEALAHYVRNYRSSHAGQPGSAQLCTLLGALLTATVCQRDVLAHLLERKVSSPAAFEWAQLLKYRLALLPERARAAGAPVESWAASQPGCWADILDSRLDYDYEYVGTCPHLVGSPQLDRSCLGLLLALQEFRCGAALGSHGVGKTATVQHLARALGRQLVTLHCSQQMSLGCLSRHLSGALQAGAWLLLEAVDQLGPGVLSGFSQLLSDLQKLCTALQEKGQVTPKHKCKSKEGEKQEQPAAALPELGLDKTELYQPCVLGNILFGERLLRVRESYGCLATLQRLPELLRLALRPVALLPPDLHTVAEVTLLAAGFREAARLAKKLGSFFWLEGELGPGPAPSRVGLLKGVVEAAIGIVYPPVAKPELEPGEKLPAQQPSFEDLAEEPALIRALCLSPFLSTLEDPRLSRVWELLRGVFPTACSLLPEAHAPPRLLSAMTAQLHEDKLQAAPQLTSTIVQLCQALRGSWGVLLVGPSGSGKTTAWKTLAKVLSRLAVSESFELVPRAGRPGTPTEVAYLPVSTVCLCPNSLSTSEFLGRMEGGIWREGVFSRLLQRMASSASAAGLGVPGAQQWLVLDGSASSDWLDPISSLFSAEPALSLPSGQRLQPPEGMKFLFELPDVSSISPSISTHCALLHCGGSCVWQALLASFLATVYQTYSMTQESVAMLRGLTEDVFPPTFSFLQQHCSSVLQPHTGLHSPLAWGIPETTAFTRVLKALLDQHLSHDKAKAQPLRRDDLAVAENNGVGVSVVPSHKGLDEAVPPHHHLLVRSIFVFAYIWGFSGHLQPRHWVLFDSFARRVLYNSRYTIELPSADSVFDLYPQPEDGKLEVFDGKYLSSRLKVVPESFTILPQDLFRRVADELNIQLEKVKEQQYELTDILHTSSASKVALAQGTLWHGLCFALQYERVLYVLDLLLGSKQPVLLAGEPGCGKSSFVEALIRPNHAYHRLAISPALSAGHVRHLLETHLLSSTRDKALLAGLPAVRAPAARGGKSCYLLLLDDLHAAELDPRRGSHPMVETLRQALSHQEVYGPESMELRHFPSAGLNCFGTMAAPAVGVHPLSPRFTRHFSILSLPTVSRESLVSIHSPSVLAWLEKFPLLARHHELATALVGATVDVYEAVKERFRPSPACYPYHFSYHHIEKVLKGLFLLRPCPGIHLTSPWEDPSASRATKKGQLGISVSLTLSTRVIVRLWLHESLRTFCDPLLSEREWQESGQLLLDITASTFCTKRSVLRVICTSNRELQQRGRARSVAEPASQGALVETGAEEDMPAGSPEEPSSQSSSDVDFPEAFDPIEQAPALALDQPDAALLEGSALGAVEPEEAGVTERKREVSLQPSPALRPRFQEQHPPMVRRASTRRTIALKSKHRPFTRKESTKPLLPSHLLLLPGEEVHSILFSKELVPASSSQENLYHERSWGSIQQQLSAFLPRGFVVCREVTQHLVRLLRVLSCPEGHGALIALHLSTGRRSLVALAAQISASQLFELAEQAEEREVRELIRKASWQAGILGRRAVLLVHQGVGPDTMQKVLNVMREGTYPGLYTTEDTAHIVKELLQENQTTKRTTRPSTVIERFYQFVRSKLHVLLLLDGRKGRAQGRGPFGYPTAMGTALLTLACSTEVYQPWSHTTLVQVATQHLEDALGHQPSQSPVPASLQALENSLASIATAMALIHRSARCYATHLAPSMPLVTPKSFLDFLHIFLMLSAQLQGQCQTQADRMKLALTKMQAVSEKQREHGRDIKYLQEKLHKAKEHVARCQQRVEREEVVQKQQEQDCQHHEARIEILTQEQHLLEQSKESATRKMNTDYRAALAGLQLQDIEELRSYRSPPASIVRVTDTLCMMFSKEPGWESAQQLLGQEDFYQELLFYPKDELPNKLFQALGQVVSDESFCAASLQSASKAAAALCQWICAIFWYHRALRIWQPTLVQLQHCKLQIRTEKGRLGDRRLQAEKLKELGSAWGLELLQATERQESLARELSYVLQEKEKADTVESSVAVHVASWTTALELLEQNCSTAQGDALLCAAALSYLGAFPVPRRQELLEKWQDICARRQSSLGPNDVQRLLEKELPCPGPAPRGPALLPVRQGFSLLALLSSKQEQRAWDRDQKPQDSAGRQAALLLRTDTHACTRRWPLLLDPDQQALTWLVMAQKVDEDTSLLFAGSDTLPGAEEPGGNEESPEKKLQVLSATDPSLEQNLLAAASIGLPVLLLDFEKSPCCPALLQLLQKETLLEVGGCMPELPGAGQVLPSFRLYLSTTLPLHALGKETTRTFLKGLNVIDLSLSQAALEDLLLEEVLHAERREAQTHWRTLQLSILQLEEQLEDTEEELLALIAQPSCPLWEEEADFLPIMQLLQTQIEALRASHQHLLVLRQHHLAMQDSYRQVARLGAALHQALQQVCRLHPLYRCSTASCLAVARRALLASKRTNASKEEALEARLVELSKGLARQLLAHAQPHLQETHSLLFSFLGALAPLRLAGQLSALDWLGFCQGLHEPVAEQLLQPASETRPKWVSATAWRECGLLECLPAFQGLRASLAQQAAQWQEYFRLPSTVVGPALCPSHTHLTLVQRAVLWRIFCPERLCSVLRDITTCLLGRPIAEDASASAATIYTCSQTHVPLLFLTPPWGTPGVSTHPLHCIQQMAQQRHSRGIVIVALGAPGCMQHVGEALRTCPKQGQWLVLTNCHLQEHWPPEVLTQLSKVLRAPEEGAKSLPLQLTDMKEPEIHPKFRLWLIAAADALEPVPGPVHRIAVPLFCETSQELKGILVRSYSQMLGQQAWHGAQDRGLALLVLHSVLLHRQFYGALHSPSRPVSPPRAPPCPAPPPWRAHCLLLFPRSEAELFIGLKAQERLAKLVSNPEEAMQELAGSEAATPPFQPRLDLARGCGQSLVCLKAALEQQLETPLPSPQQQRPAAGQALWLAELRKCPCCPAPCPALGAELHGAKCWGLAARTGAGGQRARPVPRGAKEAAPDCSFLPPALPEEEVIADTRARMQQLPSPADPASCGLYDGLQQRLLASQSQGLFAALLCSQDLWQPPRPPRAQHQQEALRQLVQQGLQLMQELQEVLQQRGWEVGARGHLPSGRVRPKPRPLLRFLLEECGSFLTLLQQVSQDLRCAQEHLTGGPCQSPRCSTILRALVRGRLPRPWLVYTPTGPQAPSSWLQTLQCRCRLLCGYLGAVAGQPVPLYHLSAFQYPRRLLLALLQETARAEKQDLDLYQLDQQVLPSLLPPSSPPQSGLYLTGLELHNALWDTRSALLQETLSAQPCLLPTIWIRAGREPWPAPRPNASLPRYSCPVYLGLPQQPAQLSSHRAVMHLALPCKMPPALCAQRRVHIVSTLP
ncbi:dynein heavy chain domain-containing protein 1 [Emydura macquarii macquarii]|uniref:dynein heavy chain domain-containing protein 1 n=1 Tax=Emydura macquarii macquarii TaxID=1129001 RepID=UPI003529D84D